MLEYLEISVKGNVELTRRAQHVQFGVFSELSMLECIYHRRINIVVVGEQEGDSLWCIGLDDSNCSIYVPRNLGCIKQSYPEFITGICREALLYLFHLKGWSSAQLEDSFDRFIAEGYKAELSYRAPLKDKRSGYSAEPIMSFTETYIEAKVRFTEMKSGDVLDQSLIKMRLTPMLMSRFFAYSSWENGRFIITDIEKEIYWCVTPHHLVETRFEPKNNSLEELNGFIKALDYKTNEIESRRLFGLPEELGCSHRH